MKSSVTTFLVGLVLGIILFSGSSFVLNIRVTQQEEIEE